MVPCGGFCSFPQLRIIHPGLGSWREGGHACRCFWDTSVKSWTSVFSGIGSGSGNSVTGGRRCCIFLRGLKDQQDFNVEGHPVAAGPCAPTTEPDLSQDGSGKHYNNTFTPNTVHLFDFVPVFLQSFGINSPSWTSISSPKLAWQAPVPPPPVINTETASSSRPADFADRGWHNARIFPGVPIQTLDTRFRFLHWSTLGGNQLQNYHFWAVLHKEFRKEKLLGQNHDLNLFFNLALVLPLLMDQVYHFVAK